MPFPLALALPTILEAAGKVIDRVVPDKAAAQKAKDELAAETQKEDFQLALQQILVNQEEAK